MGKKTYNGKSISFEVTGIEEYMAQVQKLGRNVDRVVAEAIHESAKTVRDDIEAWAQKHKQTGTMLEGVDLSEPQQDGNHIFVDVGINDDKSPGAWHAVFVEYGSPTQPADPGIRTAFEQNKSKVKNIQRDVLKRAGMPID